MSTQSGLPWVSVHTWPAIDHEFADRTPSTAQRPLWRSVRCLIAADPPALNHLLHLIRPRWPDNVECLVAGSAVRKLSSLQE